MTARWLALPLVALTGCASVADPGLRSGPRLSVPDLHVAVLDQRTAFELDDAGSAPAPAAEHDASPKRVDTPKQQRRRKILYITGLSMAGFGVLGFVGFGVGGRIVQAQHEKGYDDGTLTHEREDQLNTTGTVMNGLAIGSAVVGLAGVILGATVYGIDHARCGELRPRRKQCRDGARPQTETAPAPAAE